MLYIGLYQGAARYMPVQPSDFERDILKNPTHLTNRIARMFGRVVDARLRRLGFAVAQVPVLVALKDDRKFQQSELARIAKIEQPSMAQLLGRMERDGLITRDPDLRDQRVKWIGLTDSARERLADAHAVMMLSNDEALAGFSAEETTTLEQLLQRISDNLDRMSEELGL